MVFEGERNRVVSKPLFSVFCFASYLLSLSYGSTFLLALLVATQGGNEQDAGHVISAAMLSTFAAVLVSGTCQIASALHARLLIAVWHWWLRTWGLP